MSSLLFLNIAIYIMMFSEVESMIGQPQTLIDNAKKVSFMHSATWFNSDKIYILLIVVIIYLMHVHHFCLLVTC